MDKKCTVAKKRQNDWSNDSEGIFDVSRLFPDGSSELYKLDLKQIDEFPVLDWNQEQDESHLQTDIRAVRTIIEEHPHAAQHMHNFEPMEFLNLEEVVDVAGGSCSGPNVENSARPSSLGTSPVHEERQVEGTKLVSAMDPTSHKNDQSAPEWSAKFCGVGEREDHSAPKIGGEVHDSVVLHTTQRFSVQEHVQCPRCESFDTKFCYYNNHNLNQSRRLCKTCHRKWTVGGTLRPSYPKSMVLERVGQRRGRKSDQIVLDGGVSVSDGPEERTADNDEHSSLGTVIRNKQSVRKRKPLLSPVQSLASVIKLLNFSSGNGNPATSGASISLLDLSHFRSSSAERNGEEGLLQSSTVTENSMPLASIQNGAIHLAQNPRIYAGEPGPEFHAITPTVAPFSLPELRRLHGPVTVSLIQQLQETNVAARGVMQWKRPQDLQFKDLSALIPSRLPILGQEQEPTEMEMTVAPIRNDYGDVPEDRSECQHLNLTEKLTDTLFRDLIPHQVRTVTTPETDQQCDVKRNFSWSRIPCTRVAPSYSKEKTKVCKSADCELEKHSNISELKCTGTSTSSSRNWKAKRFPSRLGISLDD